MISVGDAQEKEMTVFAIDQQGGKGMANTAQDIMMTLCSDSHGTPHAVAYENGYEGVAGTLRANAGDNQLSTAYGITVKGNGEAFVSKETHATLATGGGQPGQGYPCVVQKEQAACVYDGYNQCLTGEVSKTITSGRWVGEIAPCLKATCYNNPTSIAYKCYDARGNGDGETANTITGDHNNRITDYTVLVCEPTYCYDLGEARLRTPCEYIEKCSTLTDRCGTGSNNVPSVVCCIDGDKIGKAERSGGAGLGIRSGDKMYTLTVKDSGSHAVCIPIADHATRYAGNRNGKQDGRCNGLGVGNDGDPMNTLTAGDRHAVVYTVDQGGGKSACNVSEG